MKSRDSYLLFSLYTKARQLQLSFSLDYEEGSDRWYVTWSDGWVGKSHSFELAIEAAIERRPPDTHVCPICRIKLDESMTCTVCKREWYVDGENLISKRRKVTLTKLPEPGDDINDIIKPV